MIIEECIVTERNYCNDLQTIVDVILGLISIVVWCFVVNVISGFY